MARSALFISVVILLSNHSTCTDVQTPSATLQEHMKKIDEILAVQQTHSREHENHLSAVLSDFLSHLIQNSDELRNLKKIQNETISKLEVELSELKASHSDLFVKYNSSVVDLEETRSKLEALEKRSDLNGNIGFYGSFMRNKNVTAHRPMTVDNVLYDSGAHYDKTTGKFLVPMNGTYQIWIDLTFPRLQRNIELYIRTHRYILARVIAGKSDIISSVSTMTMEYLHQGDSVWVESGDSFYTDGHYCNFGVVLINVH